MHIDEITRHPDTMRAGDYYGRQKLLARGLRLEGLDRLVGLRRAFSSVRAAVRNMREEHGAARSCERRNGSGSAYEAGYLTAIPKGPSSATVAAVLTEALGLGLPADLEALCRLYLAEHPVPEAEIAAKIADRAAKRRAAKK